MSNTRSPPPRRNDKVPPRHTVFGAPATDDDRKLLKLRADAAQYRGNPLHKINPGDYGLTPPACARPAKTPCPVDRYTRRAEASALLAKGICNGLCTTDVREGLPARVWALDTAGEVFEAKLDTDATYHGYPIHRESPLAAMVRRMWP